MHTFVNFTMSVEGEACPLCGEVEGKPQGGASSYSAATNTHTCDAKPHAVKTHPLHAEAEKESREDWSRPSCSHTFDLSATDTCNVDNDGEGCCTPREDGSIGESHQKTQTMHSNCSSDSGIPTPSCRICFQGAEQGDLLNPCRCDGSVRYTHQQCLLKWISERGYWTCELCCYHFHVIAIRLKKPTQWQAISLNLVEKVQILAVFLGSVFLVASISWLLWSALSPNAVWQRRDVLFQICYGMYAFMDVVCMGLICHEGAAVLSVFLRWRAVNLEWDVQNYDKASDMADISSGPRALWLPQSTVGPDGPSLRHPSRAWSGLSLCCPLPGPTASMEHARESGEVVVRVTTV